MQDLAFKCWVKAQVAKQQVKEGVKNFFSEENGGADTIIIAVILIVIVLAVAVVFRETIFGWFTDLLKAGDGDMGTLGDGSKPEGV